MAGSPRTIRELLVKIGVNADAKPLAVFDTGMKNVKAGMLGLVHTAGMVTAGIGAAAAGLVAIVTATGEAGATAERSAQKIGMSAVAYQELREAADDSGVSVEALDSGLRTLSRNAFMAGKTKGGAKFFTDLGVSVKDAKGNLKGVDALFGDVADKISQMSNETEKVALAQKVFGKSGSELIPFLNRGKEAIAASRKEAEKLGLVLDEEASKNALHFAESLDDAQDSLTGLRNVIGSAFLPVLTPLLEQFTDFVAENKDLIKTRATEWARSLSTALQALVRVAKEADAAVQEIGGWGKVFGAFAAAVTAFVAGGALVDLTETLVGLSQVVFGLAEGLVALGAFFGGVGVVGGLGTGILVVAAAMAGAGVILAGFVFGAAELTTTLTALYLALDDIGVWLQGGDSLIGRFVATLREGGPTAQALANAIDGLRVFLVALGGAAERAGENFATHFVDGVTRAFDSFKTIALDAIHAVGAELDTLLGGNLGVVINAALTGAGGAATRAGAALNQTGRGSTVSNVSAPVINVHGVTDPKAVAHAVGEHIAAQNRAVHDSYRGGAA